MSNRVRAREEKKGGGGGERLIGSDRVCGTKRCRVRVLSHKIYERLQRGLVRVSRLFNWNRRVTHVNESCPSGRSWHMSHATWVRPDESCHTIMSDCSEGLSVWMRHVTWGTSRHMSHATCVMPHSQTAVRVCPCIAPTHMKWLCHTYECDMSHEACHVTWVMPRESCHKI